MAGITRKQFGAALLGGGMLVWLSGCGGAEEYDDEDQLDGDVRVSQNHGHVLFIPEADLNPSDEDVANRALVAYITEGANADHTHTVVFSAGQLRLIATGQEVSVGSGPSSAGDSHTHRITANPLL